MRKLAPGEATPDASLLASEEQKIIETYYDIYETEEEQEIVFINGTAYTPKENIETILLIGIDTFGELEAQEGNRNSYQSDVVMLLVIDRDNSTYSLIQLNRDTMAEITVLGTTGERMRFETAQLAFSHTYGSGMEDSCELTVETVERLLLDQPIDHYVSLSMDSIGILNDEAGGVTVTVPCDLTSKDPALEEGATVTLNADQAEIFVRSRMGLDEPTNIARMERQRIYLTAWQAQVKQNAQSDTEYALNVILDLSNYMITDMDLNDLADTANDLTDYESNGIYTIEGESVVGDEFMEFYPDEDSINQVVTELFYDEADI
ncbi:MAG: LCP family protein [Clostridiales bacterium]|nr:LCP family protein [Clostridiales bacterium]